MKKYGYHPYKFLPVQNLTEDHKRQRLEFCLDVLRRREIDGNLLNKILFTDEANFSTAGMFNRKNKHFWATSNPHKIQPVRIQGRRSINVWCGIIGNRVIGPIIYNGSLTGPRYMEFLENEIENILEELPLNQYATLIWQQDGAPPHNVVPVTRYLNEKYNTWIGRNGPIRWPANSPDLTVLDIFLWGYLKNKIYYNRPENVQVLEQRIHEEILVLNRDFPVFIMNAINHKLLGNIQKCILNEGGYVENQ